MSETNWVPAVTVLGVALAGGAVLAWRSRAGRALPSAARTQLDDLERQKDAAYALLREHHAARARWEADPWERELDKLERAAAEVLRARDLAANEVPTDAVAVPPPRPRSTARTLAWGLGAAVFLGGLGWWVQDVATVRQEGQSLTGGSGGMSAEEAQAAKALAALEAAVKANPSDLAAKNRLGHALLGSDRMRDAYALAEEVVAVDNDNAEARTHQAVFLYSMGDLATAGKVLERVLAVHPTHPETLGWRGIVFYEQGAFEDAAVRWEAAIAADPTTTPMLRPLIDKARDPATAAAYAAAQEAAANAPPAAGATGAADAAASAETGAPNPLDVTGSIRGDAGAVREGDTIFLFARPEGVTKGPPTWVQRIRVTSLPLDFRIGPANAMLGGEPPAKLVLTARIDRDGNPTTRGPDDLEGASGVIAPGATGVVLELRRPLR